MNILKNIPEPESSFLEVTAIYRGKIFRILCDVYDFVGCESSDCALELFDLYLQRYVDTPEKTVVAIENIRGGKVFVYKVNNEVLCLCIHRAEVDCENICRGYTK